MFFPDGENVRALHVVLAAAVVGYLVFCLSHAYAVWLERQQASTSGTRQWP
jgi:cytochrome bd-type quinol oxidase subunit 1